MMDGSDKFFTARHRAHDATNHLLLAAWTDDAHIRNWHHASAIERLTAAADVLGYDMIKRQPPAALRDTEAPALSETDAAVRDVLRATADAGHMRAADYVALDQEPPAVTGQPGFDGRDITMRG